LFLLGRICLSFGMKDIWIRKGEEFVFHQVDEGHLGGESRGEGNVFRQKVERHFERARPSYIIPPYYTPIIKFLHDFTSNLLGTFSFLYALSFSYR